jgi:rRNA-processing protein FCF1
LIILDTNILWPLSPDSSSADLLRAIRAAGAHEVAVPWMVMEELAAQQAIKYREKLQRATEALESLRQVTPWNLDVALEEAAEDHVRAHWRRQWGTALETIPTSDDALRQAAFREMNKLAPCKEVKGVKTGGRDAAIWLSAVEYARHHAEEAVYFVSANTKDFSDGSSYPFPMCDDIAGMKGRFFHLTSMDDIAGQFTEPTETDEALVVSILKSPEILNLIIDASENLLTAYGPFNCTAQNPLDGMPCTTGAVGWRSTKAVFSSVERMHTYRIGDHEWCIADVQWHVGGYTYYGLARGPVPAGYDRNPVPAGIAWTSSVLLTPDASEPRLTVLRDTPPRPIDDREFGVLNARDPLEVRPWSDLDRAAYERMHDTRSRPGRRLGIPRPYEGAVLRNAPQHSGFSPGG